MVYSCCMLIAYLNVSLVYRHWGLGRKWLLVRLSISIRTNLIFQKARAAWEKQIHFQLSLYKKFHIFFRSDKIYWMPKCCSSTDASQLGWNLYALSPGQFWLCLFFLYCSQQIWICYCGESKKRKKWRFLTFRKFRGSVWISTKTFQCASEFLEFAELLRIPRELPCT